MATQSAVSDTHYEWPRIRYVWRMESFLFAPAVFLVLRTCDTRSSAALDARLPVGSLATEPSTALPAVFLLR